MKALLLFVLCSASAGADSTGFDIFIDSNAPSSAISTFGDQPQNLQSASCSSCPVLDSSALQVEPPPASESPPSVHDRPTNGFWPNPEAVRMFLGRNVDNQLPSGQLTESSSPSPLVLIHRAIYPRFKPADETVTHPVSDEGSWNIHPNPEGVNDSNSIITNPLPKPAIPLTVLVHMISGGMVEGGGSGDVETPTFVTTADERLSFLRGISDDVIQKYYEITHNLALNKEELREALMQWKQLLPPDLLENYENYEKVQEEKDQMLATERSHEVERIPSLNEVAKQTAELAPAIGTDDGFTETEKGAQVQGSVQTLPDEIKENLIMV